MKRRWIAASLLVAGLLVPAGPARAATALPAGKANWVVAVAGLDQASVNNYRDWVRLGYYAFTTDGAVVHNYWTWNLLDQPVRVDSVYADCSGDVPDCYVKTVDGFAGDPTGGFQGAYSYTSDGRLKITWTKDAAGNARSPLTEYWNLTSLGTVARMNSATLYTNPPQIPAAGVFSDYSATFGIGYGSNAGLGRETRATMTQLVTDARYNARKYTGTFVVENGGTVSRQSTGGTWWFGSGNQTPGDANYNNPWQVCANAQCIGWNQHNSSCNCGATFPTKNRVRYIAEIGGGRRNTEWYWCQCLAQGQPCYKANSHPRPLLQVVDDDGVFQGWVGVEAFTHVSTSTLLPDGQYASAYFGLFDMVPDQLLP
ncbi:hypothetical protein HDA40_000651 [Hamadaea flava]|uniref:Uncharacterized protein n=1 Tax=Hamadaea flava TaxID=1742688 RepID=A0ABV8LYK8_9ACTN|nr:hypothetical protein [Hamadaea flava]MCP2322144.1 hypothetical protein [Hamadaea flava]